MQTKTSHPEQAATLHAKRSLAGIEAWRGVAACLVVAVHATHLTQHDGREAFAGLWQFGRAGVDFFFVLSGFIISFVHRGDLGQPKQFMSFWQKRLLRIFPSYWIISAAFGVLLWVSPTAGRAEQQTWHIIASAFLLPDAQDPILGVGWSLRIELVFYAIFGIALLNRKVGFLVLAGWGVGILASSFVLLATGKPWFTSSLGGLVFRSFNVEFFFGIGAAMMLHAGHRGHTTKMLLLGCIGFVATGMYESFGPPMMTEWPIRHVAYASSASVIIFATACRDLDGGGFAVKWPLRLGAASYSIYLIHIPVIMVVDFAMRPWRAALPAEIAWLIVAAAAVSAGVVFSELVEQPLLRAGRRALLRPNTTTR